MVSVDTSVQADAAAHSDVTLMWVMLLHNVGGRSMHGYWSCGIKYIGGGVERKLSL